MHVVVPHVALGEVGLHNAARLIFGAVAVLLLRPSTPESCTYEMSKLFFAVSMLLQILSIAHRLKHPFFIY